MFWKTDNILRNVPHIESECEVYYAEYRQSHITLLWIWIVLCCAIGIAICKIFTSDVCVDVCVG